MKALKKRVEALEDHGAGCPIVLILQEEGEAKEDVVPRWEKEDGRLGKRHALVVTFDDAAL